MIYLLRGEFNNASARRALVDWYLSLFIMCEAWHQYNERPRALALLNSPQWSMKQTPVCIGGLGNIVLDEKSGSELEDKLEIVKWRENKVGKLLVLCFYLSDFHLRRKC